MIVSDDGGGRVMDAYEYASALEDDNSSSGDGDAMATAIAGAIHLGMNIMRRRIINTLIEGEYLRSDFKTAALEAIRHLPYPEMPEYEEDDGRE
jgi:hypothetical protein